MAAPAPVATKTVTVKLHGEEIDLSIVSFIDRRSRPHRRKQFVLVRAIEALCFNVGPGDRSTGAYAAHLSKCSMAQSIMTVEKALVEDKTITQEELDAVFDVMKPLVDPESRNRLRKVSVVPVTIVAPSLVEFGRTDITSAVLISLKKLPRAWRLAIEKEANDKVGDVDFVLNEELEQLDEECDEHAETTLIHELLLDFEAFAEIEDDNKKVSKLSTISPALKKELEEWKSFRTSNLNRFRVGTKVVEVTHQHEHETVLRFFGYLSTVVEMREPTFKKVFCSQDIGLIVERYSQWLESQSLAWSSIVRRSPP